MRGPVTLLETWILAHARDNIALINMRQTQIKRPDFSHFMRLCLHSIMTLELVQCGYNS